MNKIIKELVVVLFLIAVSLTLSNCMNKENDIANGAEIADYVDIVIQIEGNDINSFQDKITDAKKEKLLDGNSLYLTTIMDEKSCELDGFIVKRIDYSETCRIERDYPINTLSVIWTKENSNDNLEDIELKIVYWPDYDKSYITNDYSLSSVDNIYELQYNDYTLYLYPVNDCTWFKLKINNSCIDFKDAVELFKTIYDTIRD